MILVYRFYDAPDEFKKLSHYYGGDEDWVVVLPPDESNSYIPWLDRVDTCEDPQRVDLEDGRVVYIGGHA